MPCDTSKAELPKTGYSSLHGKIIKPGRNYVGTSFCILLNFHLSFFLGRIFKPLHQFLANVIQLPFSDCPNSFFLQEQVRLVRHQLYMSQLKKRKYITSPTKKQGKHNQNSRQPSSLSWSKFFKLYHELNYTFSVCLSWCCVCV